jgi:hypothetical protein
MLMACRQLIQDSCAKEQWVMQALSGATLSGMNLHLAPSVLLRLQMTFSGSADVTIVSTAG